MNVLSLFDGISCGQQALKNIGAPIDNYFASEIDKHAINITQKNHPETIQIGDVRELFINGELDNLPEIDLLIGGSPCQNLSIAVVNQIQHNQGLAGEKSSLFYDYLGVLLRIKPKYFMLENVASMKDKDRDIISESLGVEPIMIDSALLVPQDRKRYYWTNIPNVEQPEEIQNILRDIMEFGVDEKYFYNLPYKFYGWDKKLIARVGVNGHDILKSCLLYTSPSPRDGLLSRMPSSA